MIAQTIPKISAREAQTTANLFLSERLPEYFRAGEPVYEQGSQSWRVPVLLDYRYASPFGVVGQIFINASAAEVITHTPLTEMQEAGRKLYQQHLGRLAAASENSPATAETVTSRAIATANIFLLDHMPDRFCAGDPHFDSAAQVWRVPVILTYPRVGSIGEAGEIVLNACCAEVLSHTPFAELKARGLSLYEQNREKINAAFLSARDA